MKNVLWLVSTLAYALFLWFVELSELRGPQMVESGLHNRMTQSRWVLREQGKRVCTSWSKLWAVQWILVNWSLIPVQGVYHMCVPSSVSLLFSNTYWIGNMWCIHMWHHPYVSSFTFFRCWALHSHETTPAAHLNSIVMLVSRYGASEMGNSAKLLPVNESGAVSFSLGHTVRSRFSLVVPTVASVVVAVSCWLAITEKRERFQRILCLVLLPLPLQLIPFDWSRWSFQHPHSYVSGDNVMQSCSHSSALSEQEPETGAINSRERQLKRLTFS